MRALAGILFLTLVGSAIEAWNAKVFSVNGKKVTIATLDSSQVQPGRQLYILNNGVETGRAKITITYHSKVEAILTRGKAAKGYIATTMHRADSKKEVENSSDITNERKTFSKKAGIELIRASKDGDILAVKKALSDGADVNAREDEYRGISWSTSFDDATPLIKAVSENHVEVVKLLLEAGADPNLMDVKFRHAPLHVATFSDNREIIGMLIKAGADVNARDGLSSTPLFHAKTVEIAKLLIDSGAKVNVRNSHTTLLLSVEWYRRNFDRIPYVLRDQDKKIVALLRQNGAVEISPLMHAAENCQIAKAKEAIAAGADVNQIDALGDLPLVRSAVCHDRGKEFVSFLIASGADVNLHDKSGSTALIKAILNPATMKVLIAAGADINARGTEQRTALIEATRFLIKSYPVAESIEVLIASGANLNDKDEKGMTALMFAAQAESSGPVKDLIVAGANVDLKEKSGATALMYAVAADRKKNVKILLSAKADTNAKSEFGNTALMSAAAQGFTDIVELLIEAKADVNAKDVFGDTAMMKASHEGNEKIVALLKTAGAKE